MCRLSLALALIYRHGLTSGWTEIERDKAQVFLRDTFAASVEALVVSCGLDVQRALSFIKWHLMIWHSLDRTLTHGDVKVRSTRSGVCTTWCTNVEF